MEEIKNTMISEVEDQEEEAKIDIWKYILGFVEMAAVKCAIELGIADAMEAHAQPMTLTGLSSTLGCSSASLHRVMSLLVHQKLFKETYKSDNGVKSYALTPLSRLLTSHGEHSMAALVLLESSPTMLAPWHCLSTFVRQEYLGGSTPFESAHGDAIWDYGKKHPKHSKLLNDAMACNARVIVSTVVNACRDVFGGVGTVVDVGGGNGTTLCSIVKAFPWIKGINFDLPHVVSTAPEVAGIRHVGGDMLAIVPQADAAFIMNVLHDWGDEECVEILRNCREAVPRDKGKVIIVEAVIGEEDDEKEEKKKKLKGLKLMLDMVMMAHTNTGKERTLKEWEYVIAEAGFSRFIVKPIHAIPSIIIAYP